MKKREAEVMLNKKIIVTDFNECINRQDIKCLSQLMTDDHTFIDSDDNIMTGKSKMVEAWKEFFRLCPDYKNVFTSMKVVENNVLIKGYSICSVKELDGPALWTAKVIDNLISEWRVLEDTKENRLKIGLE